MDPIFALRAFKDNYIWMLHDAGHRYAVAVDPGDAAPVIDALESRGMILAGILITHHHADHVGGVTALVERYDPPVFGPATERIPHRSHALREGDEVTLDALELRFRVMEIPGHTAGHIAYVGHGMLFCGDTLFASGCGRLFEGTPEQMHRSLERLAALAPETRVYCGHEYTLANLTFAHAVEPDNEHIARRLETVRKQREQGQITLPSTIGEERQSNPFLRSEVETVKQQAEARSTGALSSAVDVFAAIRAWKDRF